MREEGRETNKKREKRESEKRERKRESFELQSMKHAKLQTIFLFNLQDVNETTVRKRNSVIFRTDLVSDKISSLSAPLLGKALFCALSVFQKSPNFIFPSSSSSSFVRPPVCLLFTF